VIFWESMGQRWIGWSGAGVVLAVGSHAHAEDIGREPLSPPEAPSALSARGPSDSRRSREDAPDVGPLVSRGPALSAGRPGFDELEAERRPTRRWYGWQPLLADGATSVGLIALGTQSRGNDTTWLVPVTIAYLAVPPVIHLAHGHPGKAVLSLGIRSVGPLLIAASLADRPSNGDNANVLVAVLGVLAIPAAITIDAAAISREDVPREGMTSFVLRMGFSPWVDPRRGAGGVVVDLPL